MPIVKDRVGGSVDREAVELWVPTTLEVATTERGSGDKGSAEQVELPVDVGRHQPGSGAAIELDRPAPGSGNMALCGNQFWLGPARAGQVQFWIDCEWVHLSIGGHRVKTLRSRFSVNDLDQMVAHGALPSGPPPLPSRWGPGSRADKTVVEVERTVARPGTVSPR